MPISSRLRYEVLRRDGHACSYCGSRPPDVVLHVDHVVPVALGGRDEPSNLTTSCAACNAGKGSTNPDDATVEAVDERNLRWRQAMALAAAESLTTPEDVTACVLAVQAVFNPLVKLGPGERDHIQQLMADGLPAETIIEAAHIARRNCDLPYIGQPRWFGYMVGVCRNKLTAIQQRAAEIMGESDGGN